jgi:multidrug resistance efflux pump
VQAELAKHNSDLQKALRQAQIDAADAQQEAAQATDVSKFNKSQDQVLALQNAAQTLQATIQNNDDIIQKFLAEMNRYTALVNTEVQTYVQNFQNNAQKFQNAQVQQAKLQADYDKGIQLLRSA